MSILRRLARFVYAQTSIGPRQFLSQLRRYQSYETYAALIERSAPHLPASIDLALDLGSSLSPCNFFGANSIYGLDIREGADPEVISCDLFRDSIPFLDGAACVVTAFDFLEHVPRVCIGEAGTRFPFVELMSEVFRVLKPGGIFFQASPAYPMKEAFQDPTHVNILSEDTFPRYFCNGTQGLPWGSVYGFNGQFELISQGWVGPRLVTLMRKPFDSVCAN